MNALKQPRQKIQTMEGLSSAIGISRPTLSKYSSDADADADADSVLSSTREHIEQALNMVDYTPNLFGYKND